MKYLYYIFRNLRLEVRDLLGRIPRVLLASFGVFFLIAFLAFFMALRDSVSSYMENRIFGRLDINEVRVMPRPLPEGRGPDFSSTRANEIPESKIRAIRKLDGVGSIYRVIRLNAPAMLYAGAFGTHLRTDILVSGVEPDFFRGTDINWKRFVPGERLPVVIPYFALDLYNNFAAASGLPELGKKALTGFMMDLSIGKSSFIPGGKESRFPAKVAGFSDRVSSAGIVVPSDFIRRYCRDNPGNTWSTILLHITSRSPAKVPSLVDGIRRLDLQVQSRRDIAEKTNRALALVDGVFFIVMIIILALTVTAIANSYMAVVYNRSQEIVLRRIVGQSKLRVVLSFIVEAAAVGAIFGAGGFFIGQMGIAHLSRMLPKWVPLLAGLEISPPPMKFLAPAAFLSAAVAAASAFVPAVIASNLNLFKSTKL